MPAAPSLLESGKDAHHYFPLQSDSKTEMTFGLFFLPLMALLGFYMAVKTMDEPVGLILFGGFGLVMLGAFFDHLKHFSKRDIPLHLEVVPEDFGYRLREMSEDTCLRERRITWAEDSVLSISQVVEEGVYRGRIYDTSGGAQKPLLYSRDFLYGRYLGSDDFVEFFEMMRTAMPKEERPVENPTPLQSFKEINLPTHSLRSLWNGYRYYPLWLLPLIALVLWLPVWMGRMGFVVYDGVLGDVLSTLFYAFDDPASGDIAAMAWLGFYLVAADLFLERKYRMVTLMSYEGRGERPYHVAAVLMVIGYVFLLLVWLDGERIPSFEIIHVVAIWLVALIWSKERSMRLWPYLFWPACMVMGAASLVAWVVSLPQIIG